MRHLLEITNEEWFRAKPWLLLGTGPSLDTFNWDNNKEKYNIAAVHVTADVCQKVDLHLLSDTLLLETKSNGRYIGTRSINNHVDRHNILYWEYEQDVRYFQNGVSLMPQHKVYPTSNTSSFFVMFMGMIGVKQLYTCGIDGGKGTAKRICKEYSEQSQFTDFDEENKGVHGHAQFHGMELIKI